MPQTLRTRQVISPTAHPLTRPTLRTETLALIASLAFTLLANGPFWAALPGAGHRTDVAGLLFAAAFFVAITSAHFALLCLVLTRWTAKPLLGLLVVSTVVAAHYMRRYGAHMDPPMIRGVLTTDIHEAGELLSWRLGFDLLLFAGIPLLLLSRVRIRRAGARASMIARTGAIVAALLAGGAALAVVFPQAASAMRNDAGLRYLITPENFLYSLIRVARHEVADANRPREPIGADARAGAALAAPGKPVALIVVVGETARAANWGLNGYARQTTPRLAGLDVINFSDVTSCGTNTEVSLPCMFSSFGRANYDETRIRNSDSLLHVVERAGIRTSWRDNQSGCKGVCAGLEQQRLHAQSDPALCDGQRCLDEILVRGLEDSIAGTRVHSMIVLHQLGNHGPSYFRRYPKAFHDFEPACGHDDLSRCTREEIVNAYDNALVYTDFLLAETIGKLRALERTHDTALVYVSDHGESLGEKGLYLHGVPYAIAPGEQTKVPMLMWFSDGFARRFGIDTQCLRGRAKGAVSHDNLFHTVLGLLDVRTGARNPKRDLSEGCRG